MAGRWLKSCWAGATGSCSGTDGLELPNNPCSACSAPAHGSALSSAAYDVQRNGLVRIATKAANLKIEKQSVQRIAQGRECLCRSFVPQHALVPGNTSEPIGLACGRTSPSRQRPGPNCRKWTVVIYCSWEAIQIFAWGLHCPGVPRSATKYRAWGRCRVSGLF